MNRLLAAQGIQKNETMYVGDAFTDYYAAHDAGLQFAGATTDLVTKEQFEHEGARTYASLSKIFLPAPLNDYAGRL